MILNDQSFQVPSVLPKGPPEVYQTYSVTARRRRGTCEEAGCPRFADGWLTTVDEATDLGARQAGYIRRLSGRKFQEEREGGLTRFTFYPGQECFEEHYVSLEVDPRFLKVGGDPWRGNPRGERLVHRSFDDWANDFVDHEEGLRRVRGW